MPTRARTSSVPPSPALYDTCQNLLTGLMVYLAELHDEYPDHIEVLEA